MKFNEIAVENIHMGFGECCGCIFNDIIFIPLSPAIVEMLKMQYRRLALAVTDDYTQQGYYREITDHFDRIFREWEKRREEIKKINRDEKILVPS